MTPPLTPGLRATLHDFDYNAHASLPSPLQEYFGNITIAGPVGGHLTKEDHLWSIPIKTWPTTLPGS